MLRAVAAASIVFLAACTCPPRTVNYATPADTLASWQSQLCHDDVQAEYACLSTGFKRSWAGFQTYYAARRTFLDEHPVAAWLVKHEALGTRAVSVEVDEQAGRARMDFEERGHHFSLGFARETWALVDLDDGQRLAAPLDLPLERLVTLRSGQQWIAFTRPRLDPELLPHITAVHFDQRWKIDAIDGLVPTPELAP